MSDLIGQQFGSYRLIQLLGNGAFGTVYLGEHIHLKSLAALKIQHVTLNDSDREKFLEEARTLARLEHPNIIPVFDFTVEQGIPGLIMKHARGGSLRQLCPPGCRLPIATVVAFIRQIADALQYAHNHGVIHRDVKPDNIFLNTSEQLLLGDFGLAIFAPSNEDLSAQKMAGTIRYMAPEQFRKQPLFASDQYALAVVAYELLCGRCPFEGNLWQIVEQHVSSSPPALRSLRPEIPAALEAVVLRALSRNPQDRFASVWSFAWALQRTYLNSQPQVVDPSQITASFRAIYRPPIARSVDNRPAPAPPLGTGRRPSRLSNRQRLLDKVHNFWIKGVLEQSLHGAALVALGLRQQFDAVSNPWGLVFQSPSTSEISLPPGTRIIQAYDEANGKLLILGDPGSGKTTLLLELARDLLARAQSDELHPMPAIFNLSSWAAKRLTIADWLVEELNVRYQVPRELGQAWIYDNQVLPLLDGLDEVAVTHRAECIEAINAYQQKLDPEALVVCCRHADYYALPTRIFLSSAVSLQPLTIYQIDEYLLSAGDKLAALRTTLHSDPDLLKLASRPLLLNVLTLAYYETPSEVIADKNPTMTQQQRVFTTYVERMLQRRSTEASYKTPKIMHWLTWLAQQMIRHEQTEFYLERMQPDWLGGGGMHRFYNVVVRLIIGLTYGLLCIIPGGLGLLILVGVKHEISNPQFGLITVLLLGLLIILTGGTNMAITPAEIVNWSWKTLWLRLARVDWRNTLLGGLFCALLGIFLLWILSEGIITQNVFPLNPLMSTVLMAALGGLLGIILFGLCSGIEDDLFTDRVSALFIVTSRHNMWHDVCNRLLVAIPFGLLCGLTFGLIFGRLTTPANGLPAGLLFGSVNGLLFGIIIRVRTNLTFVRIGRLFHNFMRQAGMKATLRKIFVVGLVIWLFSFNFIGLISALYIGIASAVVIILGTCGIFVHSSDESEKRTLVRPNQGIWRSARNSVSFGGLFGILSTLVVALSLGAVLSIDNDPASIIQLVCVMALLCGIVTGSAVGLANGGIACIQHVVLRFFLCCSGKIPWNYPRFLDHAADHLLLRKVGGGYIFIHRLLLEHFAGLNAPTPPDTKEQEKTAMLYDTQSQKPLFAIATIPLREYNRAVVGKTYTVRIGISSSRLEDLPTKPLGTSTRSKSTLEPLLFGVLLHPGENVELVGEPYQRLSYNPGNPEPQLITCPFRVHDGGPGYIIVSFYRERQWLTTIRLDFDTIKIEDLAGLFYGR
jgi:serine/threonine protein kinase